MNNRPLDKSKKSNIKCEHCVNYGIRPNLVDKGGFQNPYYCKLTDHGKHYWNRCKQFEWK